MLHDMLLLVLWAAGAFGWLPSMIRPECSSADPHHGLDDDGDHGRRKP